MKQIALVASTFALSILVAACGEDGPPASDAEACMLLEGSAFTPVTATVGRDALTPSVATGMAYTATLPASGIGYLKLDASASSYVAYLDRDVALIALEGAGTPAAVSTTKSSEACVTIKARHAFTLAAGTVYLGVGPDAGGPVHLVIEGS
jgi:hypothetical protein